MNITVIGEYGGQTVVKVFSVMERAEAKLAASKMAAESGINVRMVLDDTERQLLVNSLCSCGDLAINTVLGSSGKSVTIKKQGEELSLSFAGYCDYYSGNGTGRQVVIKPDNDDVIVNVFSDANMCRATHECYLDGAKIKRRHLVA